MQTLKGDAAPMAGMSGAFALAGALFIVLSVVGGIDVRALVIGLAFFLAGLGQFGYIWASLPRWADERAEQMDRLGERIPHLLES